jgi:hypothetical protein
MLMTYKTKNWILLSTTIFVATLIMLLGFGSVQGLTTTTTADDTQVTVSTPSQGNNGVAKTTPSTQTVGASLVPFFTLADGSFEQAGVGLRNVGSGTISVHFPSTTATLKKAFLYWTMLDDGTDAAPATATLDKIYLNGELITGKLIASSFSPCWASGHIYVYRADVTSDMLRRGGPVGDQYISVRSSIETAKSPWEGVATQQAESAHLILLYQDSAVPTTSDVTIYEASGLPGAITFVGGTASFTAAFAAAHGAGTDASVGYALADGQSFGVPQPNSKSFTWTSNPSGATTVLNAGEVYGKDPSITSKASYRGSLSDTEQYAVTANTVGGDVSGTLTWDFDGDCLSTVYAVVQG